jgi:hypothetical protein
MEPRRDRDRARGRSGRCGAVRCGDSPLSCYTTQARGKLVSSLTVYIRSPRHGSESTDPFRIIIRNPLVQSNAVTLECCTNMHKSRVHRLRGILSSRYAGFSMQGIAILTTPV